MIVTAAIYDVRESYKFPRTFAPRTFAPRTFAPYAPHRIQIFHLDTRASASSLLSVVHVRGVTIPALDPTPELDLWPF